MTSAEVVKLMVDYSLEYALKGKEQMTVLRRIKKLEKRLPSAAQSLYETKLNKVFKRINHNNAKISKIIER